jgi:hypothetical protein
MCSTNSCVDGDKPFEEVMQKVTVDFCGSRAICNRATTGGDSDSFGCAQPHRTISVNTTAACSQPTTVAEWATFRRTGTTGSTTAISGAELNIEKRWKSHEGTWCNRRYANAAGCSSVALLFLFAYIKC